MKKHKVERAIRLIANVIRDMILWLSFLQQAHDCISLNGIMFRNSIRIVFSDSYPQGLRGFTHGGRCWRLRLNPKLNCQGQDISDNISDFLGIANTV